MKGQDAGRHPLLFEHRDAKPSSRQLAYDAVLFGCTCLAPHPFPPSPLPPSPLPPDSLPEWIGPKRPELLAYPKGSSEKVFFKSRTSGSGPFELRIGTRFAAARASGRRCTDAHARPTRRRASRGTAPPSRRAHPARHSLGGAVAGGE